MLIDLGAQVDCAGTAYWRRKKAVEFPNDRRNLVYPFYVIPHEET